MTPNAYLTDHRARHLGRLAEFIRFPTVSTDSSAKPVMFQCAAWLVDQLAHIGLENARTCETAGYPIVYADWLHAEGAPCVLLYGHYDVQPPEPLELWRSPPFDLTERDGRLFARGVADNKGMIHAHLCAVEALLATAGRLPCNLKVIVEGEEELRVDHLTDFVAGHPELLAADICLNSDSGMLAADLPCIVAGLRGLAALEFTVQAGSGDLHSGKFGGVAPNAAQIMSELLATLHDPDGRIAVAGFYDRVRPLEESTRKEWAELPYGDDAQRDLIGAAELIGEPGFSALERAWGRPSLDVNGVWSGYTGEGLKTVIPALAHAKVTCRLVPDQDPDQIVALLKDHLQAHLSKAGRLRFDLAGGSAPALMDRGHPAMAAALAALGDGFGRPARVIRSGWSVPVVEIIQRHLGIGTVLMGFGLPDANEHAPDENVPVAVLEAGTRAAVRFWERYAESG